MFYGSVGVHAWFMSCSLSLWFWFRGLTQFNQFFQVHPSSISIDGTLGNFRLCDMSLGMDHSWGWFCDIRNQGAESLIKVSFDLLIRSRCLRCFMSLLFCLFLIIVLDCNKVPLSLSLSSLLSILIALKMMIMKDMITACGANSLQFVLCSSTGLYKR